MPASHWAATLTRKEAGMGTSTGFQRRSCWTDEYLLAHCERYVVEGESGERVGIVDRVLCDEDGIEAEELVVRSLTGAAEIVVPVEQVIELRPTGERIVVSDELAEVLAVANGAPG
jgi:hypothetical protein